MIAITNNIVLFYLLGGPERTHTHTHNDDGAESAQCGLPHLHFRFKCSDSISKLIHLDLAFGVILIAQCTSSISLGRQVFGREWMKRNASRYHVRSSCVLSSFLCPSPYSIALIRPFDGARKCMRTEKCRRTINSYNIAGDFRL